MSWMQIIIKLLKTLKTEALLCCSIVVLGNGYMGKGKAKEVK